MNLGCCDFAGDEGWLESAAWVLRLASIFSTGCSQPSSGLLLIHAHLWIRLTTLSHLLAFLSLSKPFLSISSQAS